MLEDFARILARVQSDLGFFVGCQTNPAATLHGYTLTESERETLLKPEKLRAMLEDGAIDTRPHKIIITFSGRHDWINKTRPITKRDIPADHDAQVARETQAVLEAGTHEARNAAALRLVSLLE